MKTRRILAALVLGLWTGAVPVAAQSWVDCFRRAAQAEKEQRYGEAAELYSRVVETTPDETALLDCLNSRAGCYKRLADYSRALADYGRALELAKENARKNGVEAEIMESDGYAALAGRRFAAILQNPPIRAGKPVIYRMFADGARSLLPGGGMWLVIRKQQGAPSAMSYLETLFSDVTAVEKKSGYWVIRCTGPAAGEEQKHV